MRQRRMVVLALALALIGWSHGASSAGAQPLFDPAAHPAAAGRDVPLLLSATAAGRLKGPDVVFLHLGDKAGYDAAHIPGARHVTLDTISRPRDETALRLQLLDAPALVSAFERLGISDRSHVVVYFGKDWATPAARVFFALDYLGLGRRVSYLDGGMPAWQAAGLPVTADVPPPAAAGRITTPVNAVALADLDAVKAARTSSSVSVVDARDTPFYTGADDAEGRYARPGHIAGALSVPFGTLLTPSGHFKSEDELRAIFRAAGIGEANAIVSYCHIGQQASLVYVVARMLGHEARLYDGSFEEWTATPDAPVEKGPGRDVSSRGREHGRP